MMAVVSGAAPIPAAAGAAAHDEAWGAEGVARSHYEALLRRLADTDLDALVADVAERVTRDGVAFGEHAGPGSFAVDAVPRILPAAEWEALAAGLEQRVGALNAF